MIAPYNCVVVANGRFPQTALPLRLLHEASVVIACDGAIEALDKAGITPAAISLLLVHLKKNRFRGFTPQGAGDVDAA